MRRLSFLAVVAGLLVLSLAAVAQAQMRPQVGCEPKGCWPVYSYRDVDTDVAAAQYLLLYHGAQNLTPNNGYFGTQTRAAVQKFQSVEGLKVTGVIDGATWQKLIKPLRYGARNQAVRALQYELANQYGYNLPVTGYYGDQTRADVKDFQKKHGLAVTGNTDAATWQAIISTR
ncbi:peptidoglycan-binding domain-containing protein [Rubrobacter calidifluminis]|uniref:peptidoglycan-binding domain-containing protein n=1 Tax=Rubrobacter calidifluminis TaxID=1392640 RepID=UPI0023616198|nr:peptidoglycan-binding protein [Rubrobacter calidifluminis]